MSFSVDLWNGFEVIKNQTKIITNKLRTFYKLLSSLKGLESDYVSKLDLIIRDCKDNSDTVYLIDDGYNRVVEALEYSHKQRTNYINYLNQLTNEQSNNSFLEQTKSKLTSCLNEYEENSSSFDRLLKNVIDKQILFHKNAKDLSLNVAQIELDEIHNKNSKINIDKILDKVKQTKEEYTECINDCNKERENYNHKCENLLENLENNYRSILERFKKDIMTLSNSRFELFKKLSNRETNTMDKIYSKIEINKDIFTLIINNSTREFPLVKIELCPIKSSALIAHVRQKIKIKEEEIERVTEKIKDYFDKNNIFKEELFFNKIKKNSNKSFSFFGKKEDTSNDSMKNFKAIERNKKFLENFADTLFKDTKIDPDEFGTTEKEVLENIIIQSRNCLELVKGPENRLIYIETLLKRLTYLRSKGTLELRFEGYGIILSILDIILQENPKDSYIIKNALILCQTFYKMENNKKIFLSHGLKNRGIFNSVETWHRAINYSLSYSSKEKDLTTIKKNDSKEKTNKEATAVLLAYLWDILQFTDDDNVFNQVKEYYIKLYEMDENIIEQQVIQYKNTINKNKEEEKEKEKEKENLNSQKIEKEDLDKNNQTKNETEEKKEVKLKINKEDNKKPPNNIINNVSKKIDKIKSNFEKYVPKNIKNFNNQNNNNFNNNIKDNQTKTNQEEKEQKK